MSPTAGETRPPTREATARPHGWRPTALLRESAMFAYSGRVLTGALVVAMAAAVAVAGTLLAREWSDTVEADTSLHRDGRDIWVAQSDEGIDASRCEAVASWQGVQAAGGTAAATVVDDILLVPFTGRLAEVFGANDPAQAVASVVLGPSAASTARYPSGRALIDGELVAAVTLPATPRSEGHVNSVFVRAAGIDWVDSCYVSLANGVEATLVPALTSHLGADGSVVDVRQQRPGPTGRELIEALYSRPVRWLAPAFGLMAGVVGVGASLARRSELALYRDTGMTRAQTVAVANGAAVVTLGLGGVLGLTWMLALTSNTIAGAVTAPFVIRPLLDLLAAALVVVLVGNTLIVTGLSITDRR